MANCLACRLSRWLHSTHSRSFQLAHAVRESKQSAFTFSKHIKRFIHSSPLAAANGRVKHALSAVQGLNLPGTTKEVEKPAEKPVKKSRNQKKKDAALAVHWGMELAKLSSAQLKRIVRAASLENEVLDAVMLVKKLGSDVREGKRRQFNYIGGLLRNVQPELMETLLQATKDGDMDAFHAVSRRNTEHIEEDMELEEDEKEEEIDEEVLPYMEIAKRWSEGLISGDASISKEVYSLYNIDFDRQIPSLVTLVFSMSAKVVCPGADSFQASREPNVRYPPNFGQQRQISSPCSLITSERTGISLTRWKVFIWNLHRAVAI